MDARGTPLERVPDGFEVTPAIINTPVWDVIAWNRAAAALLTDLVS